MAIRVGINGFGRIGRMVFRAAIKDFPEIEVVAINDLLEPDYLAYMLQYDSVHGRFKGQIAVDGNTLVVNGKKIRLTQERDPAHLKWGEVGADIVIEATGLFLTKETGQKHLDAGAKKVIMSAPSKDDTPMFVYGVNDKTYAGQAIISQRLVHDQLPGAGREGAPRDLRDPARDDDDHSRLHRRPAPGRHAPQGPASGSRSCGQHRSDLDRRSQGNRPRHPRARRQVARARSSCARSHGVARGSDGRARSRDDRRGGQRCVRGARRFRRARRDPAASATSRSFPAT